MTDLVDITSIISVAAGTSAVLYNVATRPSHYATLIGSTFLGGLVMSYHMLIAKAGGFDPIPAITAMSLFTSATLGAAAIALVGGPSITSKVDIKGILALGGAVLMGTLALSANPYLLALTQRYDEATSCAALVMFGAALMATLRSDFTLRALALVTTVVLLTTNVLWFGGDPFVRVLNSVTNVVLALLAVHAQPRADRGAGAAVSAT